MENENYKIVKTNNRYKKSVRGKGKNSIGIVLLVVVAVISILAVYEFCHGATFFKNKRGLNVETIYNGVNGEEHGKVGMENSMIDLVVKQYGVFTKEENAVELMNKIGSGCGYIIRDGDKIKVMGEIYPKGKIEKVIPQNNSTNYVRVNMSFNISHEYDKYTEAMIDAILQVANEFSISEVEAVKTQDIKRWVDNLTYKVTDKGESYEKAERVKKYIKNLPEEVKSENLKDIYKFIYDIVVNG